MSLRRARRSRRRGGLSRAVERGPDEHGNWEGASGEEGRVLSSSLRYSQAYEGNTAGHQRAEAQGRSERGGACGANIKGFYWITSVLVAGAVAQDAPDAERGAIVAKGAHDGGSASRSRPCQRNPNNKFFEAGRAPGPG